jgi:hypothetical protein
MTHKQPQPCASSCCSPADVCNPCGDYFDPNEWYAIFCNVAAINTGYANRIIHTDGNTYYWESNTMAADINGLLVNWQFDTSNPYSIVGNTRKYRSGIISTPSLAHLIKVYSNASYSQIEANFFPQTVNFNTMYARIEVTDICGIRYVKGTIQGNIVRPSTIFDPEGRFDTPNDTDFPLWTAEHVYSLGDPGVACGVQLQGTTGYSVDFTNTSLGISYPSLLGPNGSSSVKIMADSNDSLLSCDGYGE